MRAKALGSGVLSGMSGMGIANTYKEAGAQFEVKQWQERHLEFDYQGPIWRSLSFLRFLKAQWW